MNNTMNHEFKNLVTKINQDGELISPRGLLVKELAVETLEIDPNRDRKSTRLNSSHVSESRMPSSA